MSVKIPKSLAAAGAFCSVKVVRYALTGVRVQKKGKEIRVSASDGRKLLDAIVRDGEQKEFVLPNDEKSDPSFTCIVPKKAWDEASRTCGKELPEFNMVSINGHVSIKSKSGDIDRLVRMKHVDGSYPDVSAVFAKDKPIHEEVFDPKLLGEALLAMAKMKAHKPVAKLYFFGDNKPLLITMRGDDADIRVVVMPMAKNAYQ